ncbi:MAG: endolytic transglycosylase MltG, partial [Deltaproteobacteria bacterium]|nr:endolytic transglycosylase MltG [Deltaproteobacteria bacterium]
MKKLGIAITSTLVLGLFVSAAAYLDILNYARTPAGTEPVEQVVVVKSGQGFQSFAKMLRERGIIEHPTKFRLLARIKGYDKKIKAGEYELSSAMTPIKILEIMVQGKVLLHRLTI